MSNWLTTPICCYDNADHGFAYTLPTVADKILHHNDISYGVYIYHMIVVNAFVHLGLIGNLAHLTALFLSTLILAYLS